ncbi:MAG: ABC transporter substrate-binding protein [Proteobacteria bacterium]|nr:ABC transporter substrate-binding protein [Pseudomonadota bacterium]
MTRGNTVLGISILSFLILISVASAQNPTQGLTDSAIRIGLLCPLSGPSASMGKNFLEGLQTFFNHFNDIGGIHERNIVLLAQDHGDDPVQGVAAAAQMQTTEEVFSIVSASGMATTQAVIDRAIATENFPVLVFGSPSKSLIFRVRRNVFAFGMPYGDQITLVVEYLLKRGPRVNPRMGLLFQDSPLGEEVREGFHRVVQHYGLEMVGEELYNPGTIDFVPLLDRLWAARADHVVLGATAWDAIKIMREAGGMDWFPQFIGTSLTADPLLMVDAGEEAENYLMADYLAKSWEKVPGVTLMIGNTQKYFPGKNTNVLHRYHVLGYVGGVLVGEALRDAGRELTRETFVGALERIHALNTHGLAGAIGYEPDSRSTPSRGRVFRYDRASERFLPLTDWGQPLVRTLK